VHRVVVRAHAIIAEATVRNTRMTLVKVAGRSLPELLHAIFVELHAWQMMAWDVRLAGVLSHFQRIGCPQHSQWSHGFHQWI